MRMEIFFMFINGNRNMIKKCTLDQVHSVLSWTFFDSKNTFQIELHVWGLFGVSWCLQNKTKKTTEKNPIKMYIFFNNRNIINFMHIATLLIKLFLGKTVQPRERNGHHTEHGSWIVFRNSFSLIWQISPFFLLNPHFLPSFVCSRFFLLFLEFCSSALIAWFLLLFLVVFVSRKKEKKKRKWL